jgi:GDP-L-fucose synthase
MRIFVTGGSGFLGRRIVARATEAGHDVHWQPSRKLDFHSMSGVDAYFAEHGPFDIIVHSAAHYGGIGINQTEPATIFNINMQMALNIFELARRSKVGKIVPIGSACAYPGYADGDLKESEFWDGPLHETVEAYGMSKKVQLVAQHAYYRQYGIESCHPILTNLYGPHDVFDEYRSHVLSALIRKFSDADKEVVLWGDGTPIREFLYVEDAADAIVKCLDMPHDPEPINVGTGEGITIRGLAETIASMTGFSGTVRWDTSKPNGAARKVLDVRRMRERLGWTPPHSLRDGLRKTIEWYRANKETADARR